MKLSKRFSIDSLSQGIETPSGRIFFNNETMLDLTDVSIIGKSVDTIRQLFYGLPRTDTIQRLESAFEAKEQFFSFVPGGDVWHLTKLGKVARYRFKLQNNDEGIVILFGSYFSKLDAPGQHLKIELSPHFISQRNIQNIWDRLNGDYAGLSKQFLTDYQPKGCAVHLAVDYQSQTLPDDLPSLLSTYSRTIRTFDSLSELDLTDFINPVASYGGPNVERNYLIGKADSFQVCAYDKTKEAIKSDKIDYFQRQWQDYDKEKKVRRLELRFHHSVVREVGNGMDKTFESWLDIAENLTDLWRYGMKLTYIRQSTDSKFLHPFWQLLTQDIEFYLPSKGFNFCRKKKESIDPIAKNISLLIGNIITLAARAGWDAKQTHCQLKRLTFYPQIVSYYISRGLSEKDLRENISIGLLTRKLIGKAA
jgi:hypothetical protein